MMDQNYSRINIQRVEYLYLHRMYMNHCILYCFQWFQNDNYLFHIFVDKLDFLFVSSDEYVVRRSNENFG